MCRGVGCLRQLTPSHLSPYVLLPPFFSICLGIHWGLWVTITAESHGGNQGAVYTPPSPPRDLRRRRAKEWHLVCVCVWMVDPCCASFPQEHSCRCQASEPRAAKRYLVSRRHYLLEPWRGPCRTTENTVPGVTFITCPQK